MSLKQVCMHKYSHPSLDNLSPKYRTLRVVKHINGENHMKKTLLQLCIFVTVLTHVKTVHSADSHLTSLDSAVGSCGCQTEISALRQDIAALTALLQASQVSQQQALADLKQTVLEREAEREESWQEEVAGRVALILGSLVQTSAPGNNSRVKMIQAGESSGYLLRSHSTPLTAREKFFEDKRFSHLRSSSSYQSTDSINCSGRSRASSYTSVQSLK